MLLQAEHRRSTLGGVAANAFKHADPVMQARVEEGNCALRKILELLIDPNKAWSGSHREPSVPQYDPSTVSSATASKQAALQHLPFHPPRGHDPLLSFLNDAP